MTSKARKSDATPAIGIDQWPRMACAKLLTREVSLHPKLDGWARKYPDAAMHLAFITPPSGVVIDERMRRAYLTKLIKDGMAVVKAMENCLISDPGYASLVHPAPACAGLREVREWWLVAMRFQMILRSLAKATVTRSMPQIRMFCDHVSQLLSLLVSRDALPMGLLPAVKWADLHFVPRTVGPVDFYRHSQQMMLKQIEVCAGGNGGDLAKILKDCRGNLDSMGCMAPVLNWQFSDAVRHPRGPGAALVARFRQDVTAAESGKRNQILERFILALGKEYRLGESDAMVLSAAVSNTLLPQLAPPIEADGPGTEDFARLSLALDLFWADDPMVLLSLVGRVGPERAAEALRTVTTRWREVLLFAQVFTVVRFLSSKMQCARERLSAWLSGESN